MKLRKGSSFGTGVRTPVGAEWRVKIQYFSVRYTYVVHENSSHQGRKKGYKDATAHWLL